MAVKEIFVYDWTVSEGSVIFFEVLVLNSVFVSPF